MEQVIEVDKDDFCEIIEIEDPKKKKIFKCLNPDCKSGLNTIKASDSIRRFYGVDAYCKGKYICQKCLKHVLLEKNTIINLFKSGTNIFSKHISLTKKTYVLSESDSDESDSESISEQSEYEYDLEQLKNISTREKKFPLSSSLVTEDDKIDLKDVVLDIVRKNGFNKQLLDGQNILQRRLKANEMEYSKLDKEYKDIRKQIDKVRSEFYDFFRIDEKFVPTLEIGPAEMFNGAFELTEVISRSTLISTSNLPPVGPLIRHPIEVGDKIFVMKTSKLSKWVEGTVLGIQVLPGTSETVFQVQYMKDKSDKLLQKFVSAKHLAYNDECIVRVSIGTRIIAVVENNSCKSFYVGIIAESPSAANRYRYLVFFDDGYAQYVTHSNIRVVAQGAVKVWEDVEEESKGFIKEYLETYPERPMVRLQKENHIKTELEGKWFKTQVKEVDCSLVELFFPIQARYEWIYRGSTRLAPLYHRKLNSKIKSEVPNRIIRRRTLPVNKKAPIVEFVNVASNEERFEEDLPNNLNSFSVENQNSFQETNLSSVPVDEQVVLESKGYYTTMKCNISSSVVFSPHQCSYKCIRESNDIIDSSTCSPLIKPLMLGWKRQICKQKKTMTIVKLICTYVSPCGRRLRTNGDILLYINLTKSNLLIDEFSFNPDISVISAWEPSEKKLFIPDITEDRECVHISCVNSIDTTPPNELLYCSERVPSERVLMNLDSDYLVCCSCTDNCSNKETCECWQLTIGAYKNLSKRPIKDSLLGYNYKRLFHQIPSGIYECNSRCSCRERCLNRVAQFPIKQKLQLFKTAKRGWGIRTLTDIPKGTFICVYVGKVLTETEANEDGHQGGDEYYANLDYIEVVENFKYGYESDVEDIENDGSGRNSPNCSDGDSDSNEVSDLIDPKPTVKKRKHRHKEDEDKGNNSSESNQNGDSNPIRLNVNDSEDSNDISNRRRQTFEPKQIEYKIPDYPLKSMRDYYENDEAVYVMDAKKMGNIGRYFNHSCNPNVFVQNVFVDTHDPRFPWISFFAGLDVRASTELTWDYNYEVGSVPGRTKYCYCNSSNCRGRLL